jgi:hypothetical protein
MNLTIIITASYIPTHPSIQLIREVIESLRYTNCSDIPVLLAHDYNPHPHYATYLKNLEMYIADKPNFKIILRDSKGHLTGNVRHALTFVNTEFILLLQHDLPFIRQLPPLSKVIEDMKANPSLKHVRFNRLINTYNMYDKYWLFGKQVSSINFIYTRTPGWSDQNHLARTSYYKDLIMKECKDGTFMEAQLYWSIKDETSHEDYGTYLFGKLEEAPYTGDLDGRNTYLRNTILIFQNPNHLYSPIINGLSGEFNFIWVNPACFVISQFQTQLETVYACLIDLHYYADILKLISSKYYSKINFICSKEAEIHMYGSDSVKDVFSCSATTPELSLLLTKHTVKTIPHLVPLNDLSAWRTMIQAMIHKNKRVRVYTKGIFDSYDLEDVRRFEQIKRSYPLCSLVVGVVEDSPRSLGERIELVQSCKFVDEVCKTTSLPESDFFKTTYSIDIIL